MEQIQYTISDAAKLLKVETHVLRYWEEELGLCIPRNKMGHRIYQQKQIETLRQIIEWKEEGFTLKEISERINPAAVSGQVIPYPSGNATLSTDDKMKQFKTILSHIVSDAIKENSKSMTSDIASSVSEHVNKELDFLFREKEEADEKRFRELDERIRFQQKARQETAATQSHNKKGKKRHFWGKK